MGLALDDRMEMPEPLTGLRPVRRERQTWKRLGRAEGELEIGWDPDNRPVRVEYHWKRFLSRSDPVVDDVHTAELWVRQVEGDWLYLLRPSEIAFTRVAHHRVRAVFARHLGIDAGE